MMGSLQKRAASYTRQHQKSFAGALGAFLQEECPQLGGRRTREVLVASIVKLVDQFYPKTTHLRAGQTPWTTVCKNEKASYGKRISDTRLTSVVLDLVRCEDAAEYAAGKGLDELKREAVIRLFTQADAQGGCLTQVEVGLLLKIHPESVRQYLQSWEKEHEVVVPRRGTIHDMGPTLTHKKQIIHKLFLEGRSVEQVCRETSHSPDAVHRYIQAFKQVLLCHRKGLSCEQIAFAVRMSSRLVGEYLALIEKFAADNPAVEALLLPKLGANR